MKRRILASFWCPKMVSCLLGLTVIVSFFFLTSAQAFQSDSGQLEENLDSTHSFLGMEFKLIPSGSFMMGSGIRPSEVALQYSGAKKWYKDEHPQRRVTISKPFYIMTTEVTQGQWETVMGSNPSYFKNCGSNCPVENVSWEDVQEFIQKLNQREGVNKYRLPTEAEWEYACRAGSTTRFIWGNNSDCSKANYGGGATPECKGKNPSKTVKVGSYPPNAWGLYC